LNNGYGTAESQAQQSIAALDLSTLQLKDFPDSRFVAEAHQSYFLGLAFASNGRFLYASVVSLTDTTGKKRGNIGNGIAVYRFEKGKVKRSRFLPIPPLKLAPGKRVATALGATLAGTAIAYPAGFSVISVNGNDELLVANNLSDTVVLLDSQTGKILRRFDVSTNEVVPRFHTPWSPNVTRVGPGAACGTRPKLRNCKILWRDRKGNLPMPSPKHTVLPKDKQQDND